MEVRSHLVGYMAVSGEKCVKDDTFKAPEVLYNFELFDITNPRDEQALCGIIYTSGAKVEGGSKVTF